MKKLYVGAAALLLSLGMAACGGNGKKDEKPAPSVDETAILADKNVESYALLGPNTHHIGDTYFADWGKGVAKDGAEIMTATSVSDVRTYDNALADKIAKRGASALYTLKGVGIGDTKVAGFTTFWGPDKKEVNGHFCVKFGAMSYDETTEVNVVDLWIPDPHKCKIDSLTTDTFWVSPNYSETPDDNGYDWTTNPVVTKAGVYNFTLVRYAKPLDGATYGIGATLVEEKQEKVPAPLKAWRVIGSIDGWNEHEAAHLFAEDRTCTITTTKAESIKVAKFLTDNTTDWGGALGFDQAEAAEGVIENDGGNIKLPTAGTYKLTLNETFTKVAVEKIA